MGKKLVIILTVLTAVMLMIGLAYSAAPPVNQYLGFPDSTFNDLGTAECRFCHNQNPPPGVPVNSTYLPTRHHLKVKPAGQPQLIIPIGTAAPCADTPMEYASVACIPGTSTYECLSCHKDNCVLDPNTGEPTCTLDTTFRTQGCSLCHEQIGNDYTVHHKTQKAQDGLCATCHGNFVASVGCKPGMQTATDLSSCTSDTPQPAPTYQPSIVTPWPSGKLNGDNTVPANSAGKYAGNCNFCHNTFNGTDPSTVNNGPFAPVIVYTNDVTHHKTGFYYNDPTSCVWCHNGNGFPTGDGQSIRTCQNCHDIRSLHNIQYDNLGSGINPGNMAAGFGHIGDQPDCWGCHGNNGQPINGAATGAPGTSATVPGAYTTSFLTAKAGQSIPLTVSGNGFINSADVGGTIYNFQAKALLTDSSGLATELAGPVTPTTVDVTLPSTLAPDAYKVQAKKSNVKKSNPLVIALTPPISISSATCSNGSVTVNGSGFGSFLNATDSGTNVTGIYNGATLTGKVASWTDSGIAAKFTVKTTGKRGTTTTAVCPTSVTVKNVFDSGTKTVTVSGSTGGKPRK